MKKYRFLPTEIDNRPIQIYRYIADMNLFEQALIKTKDNNLVKMMRDFNKMMGEISGIPKNYLNV